MSVQSNNMVQIDRETEEIFASDDKLKHEDVRILQEWIKKQPHLPQLTELHVILFLHSCYYSIEAAKSTIDIYFTRRTHQIHIFEHLDEDDLRRTASNMFVNILPKKTPQGSCILFLKLSDLKPENFNVGRIIRLVDMVAVRCLYGEGPVEGAVAVFDFKGYSLGHLARFNIVAFKNAMDHLQEGAPVRLKGIHVINALPILDKFLALVKPLVKKELFDIIKIHSSFDTFYKYVPKECLPADYGGELGTCQILQEENVQGLLNDYEFFVWNDSFKVDESKRLEKSHLFGLEGTFKKLDID